MSGPVAGVEGRRHTSSGVPEAATVVRLWHHRRHSLPVVCSWSFGQQGGAGSFAVWGSCNPLLLMCKVLLVLLCRVILASPLSQAGTSGERGGAAATPPPPDDSWGRRALIPAHVLEKNKPLLLICLKLRSNSSKDVLSSIVAHLLAI